MFLGRRTFEVVVDDTNYEKLVSCLERMRVNVRTMTSFRKIRLCFPPDQEPEVHLLRKLIALHSLVWRLKCSGISEDRICVDYGQRQLWELRTSIEDAPCRTDALQWATKAHVYGTLILKPLLAEYGYRVAGDLPQRYIDLAIPKQHDDVADSPTEARIRSELQSSFDRARYSYPSDVSYSLLALGNYVHSTINDLSCRVRFRDRPLQVTWPLWKFLPSASEVDGTPESKTWLWCGKLPMNMHPSAAELAYTAAMERYKVVLAYRSRYMKAHGYEDFLLVVLR